MNRLTIICMLSLLSITGKLFSQESRVPSYQDITGRTFSVPPDLQPCRFDIQLSKGNHLYILLREFNDIYRLQNIDSLLAIFMKDMEPFRDSLSNELTTKRIDYVIDTNGMKKIRLQQHFPKGESFLLRNGNVARLKSEQDTINILGAIPPSEEADKNNAKKEIHYYSIILYLNKQEELPQYTDGQLGKVIAKIEEDVRSKTRNPKKNDYWNPTAILGTYSVLNGGSIINGNLSPNYNYNYGYEHNSLGLDLGASLQNYKDYLAPAAYIGLRFILRYPDKKVYHTLTAGWEPFFTFEKNNSGSLQTYRNDFITLGYTYKSPASNFFNSGVVSFSLSYLISRRGEVFDKNTFRLSLLGVQLHEVIYIEPQLFFHDFFKNVTPGLRISVGL